jgi:uncharacterized protein YheU (UPF0270 family)
MNNLLHRAILRIVVEEMYEREVVETLMEHQIIGEGKDYASKEDWIESRIADLVLRARRLIRSGAFQG